MQQAGKDRLKARIGDAHLAASTAPETAPAASAALGSALESGMASGVATALDAEHVDDAGTPPRPVKTQVHSQLVCAQSIQTYCISGNWKCDSAVLAVLL